MTHDAGNYVLIIQGLMALLILVVGYMLSTSLKRLKTSEEKISGFESKCGDFVTHIELNGAVKDTATRIVDLRDRQDKIKDDLYKHQDEKTEKIRTDLNKLGDTLRAEMHTNTESTNRLLTELIKQGKPN